MSLSGVGGRTSTVPRACFALPQQHVADRRRRTTRQRQRMALVAGIERTDHRRRRQAVLGRSGPHRERDHRDHTAGCAPVLSIACAGRSSTGCL